MVVGTLRSLWDEPRPATPPRRSPWDWVLVPAFGGWAVVEAVVRQDMVPLPQLIVAASAAVVPLLWRRVHPLAAVLVAFGVLTLVDGLRIVTGTDGSLPSCVSATLILTYALFRWGSGREAAAGLVLVLVWLAATCYADSTGVAETVAGYGFFLLAATLGAAVRFRERIRIRDREEVKARERELLARELHDTVAHHVSGIVIQAQAGRAVAVARPDQAVAALVTIEDAATRTLTELRAIVGVLRAPEDAGFAPQPGLADVASLATGDQTRPRVEVTFAGDLDDLDPATDAALFRLAQESVTNARRHARQATHVGVTVTGDRREVQLTVVDDGAPGAPGRSSAGFGLLGMQERVALLGGTFHAGPVAGRGWRVEAVLPRTGRSL